jgi:hypothetical protein
VPPAQLEHVAIETAPLAVEKVPAEHGLHEPAIEAEYVPGPQRVHEVANATE